MEEVARAAGDEETVAAIVKELDDLADRALRARRFPAIGVGLLFPGEPQVRVFGKHSHPYQTQSRRDSGFMPRVGTVPVGDSSAFGHPVTVYSTFRRRNFPSQRA